MSAFWQVLDANTRLRHLECVGVHTLDACAKRDLEGAWLVEADIETASVAPGVVDNGVTATFRRTGLATSEAACAAADAWFVAMLPLLEQP